MLRIIIQILVFLYFANALQAQVNFGFDQLPVQNYSRNDYKSGNQNWSISQDKNGIIYSGNNNGLLVFNGNTWKLCKLPNQTTVRSVATSYDGKIYVGSFEEFGYFEADEFGVLHYVSLSALLKNYDFHNEEIWKIIIHENIVYFQSFTVVFEFKNNKLDILQPGGFISCFSNVNNRLIIAINSHGLFELKDSKFSIVSEDSFFKTNEISVILPYDAENWLVATSQEGVHLFKQNSGTRIWESELQQAFRHDQVNRGLITIDGKIVLGTILGGVYILKKDGTLLQHIDKRNGLQNNTVLDLYSDMHGDVWTGLDRGIDLLILNSDISFFYDNSGKIGSVYSLQLKDNDLYIGTNQGLYHSLIPKNISKPFLPDFNLINNSQGQVWSIYDTDNQLLCGHNRGTFEVEKEQLNSISNVSGGLSYEIYTQKGKEYLIGSTYTKLVVYEKKSGKWRYRNVVENFMHPIKQIKVDYLGNIWASHFVKGLYRLNLNDSLLNVENSVFYGKSKGFNSDYQINVARLQNRIVFINDGKLFTYNDLLDSIIPYNTLETQLGMKLGIKYITQTGANNTWIIADQGILNLSMEKDIWHLKKIYPSDLFYDKVIPGQEFISPLNEGNAILALDNGLAYIKSDTLNNKESILIKPLLTRIISIGKSENQLRIMQDTKNKIHSISYWNNNLVFQYSFPNFRGSSYFLVQLQGLDNKWIKTERPEYKYDRLPPGTYTFLLKAVNANGTESETIQWSFSIKPPWYLSKLAKLIYLAVLLAFMAFIRYYYKKRLMHQTRRMKIEKERELIKLRNEKLEAEVMHKSKELANTTFSIIKKNEMLLEIRKMLMYQRRQSTTGQLSKQSNIIRLLDKNISNEDDWKIFESNFEQAHEEFLKRIKEKFPELTPSDLKLCAYLRMNLSSKKIALLLGITIRGVENHRYRLRKKMDLEHDSNLIDYLMSF